MNRLNRIIHLNKVDSTNIYAKKLIDINTFWYGDIIYTEKQTGGYGKGGSIWESPEGGICLSCILKSSYKKDGIMPYISLLVAKSFIQIEKKVNLKWPNDLFYNGLKLGGVLAEEYKEKLIIGIGLNTFSSDLMPNALKDKATSIPLNPYQKEKLIQNFIYNFNRSSSKFLTKGFTPFVAHWNELSYYHNKQLSIHDNSSFVKGIEKGIDNKGRLIVERASDTILIERGEVTIEKTD